MPSHGLGAGHREMCRGENRKILIATTESRGRAKYSPPLPCVEGFWRGKNAGRRKENKGGKEGAKMCHSLGVLVPEMVCVCV